MTTIRTAIAAAVFATAFCAGPAKACSWPADLYRDTIRSATKIKGSLEVRSTDELTIAGTDGSTAPWSRLFRGVVTDRRGRATEIEFEIFAVEALRTCTPFTLPEGNVSGTFYLERLESGRYQLVHWKEGR